jgi:nucleoredoxin
MVNVTYLSPDGTFVAALCRAEDVGKAPKTGQRAFASNLPAFGKSELFKKIEPELVDADGRPFNSKRLAGSKYVLLFLSARWCPGCVAFTPELLAFYKNYQGRNDFEILFLSNDKNPAEMAAYMKESSMPWPSLRLGSRAHIDTYNQYKGRWIPALVLLDENGNVLSHSVVNGEDLRPEKVLNDLKQKL